MENRTQNSPAKPRKVAKRKTRADKPKKSSKRSDDEVYEIERLIDHRTREDGVDEFLAVWKGYPESEATWVAKDNFVSSAAFADDVRALKANPASSQRRTRSAVPERRKRRKLKAAAVGEEAAVKKPIEKSAEKNAVELAKRSAKSAGEDGAGASNDASRTANEVDASAEGAKSLPRRSVRRSPMRSVKRSSSDRLRGKLAPRKVVKRSKPSQKRESEANVYGKVYNVEELIAYRNNRGRDEFLAVWEGFPREEASWVARKHVAKGAFVDEMRKLKEDGEAEMRKPEAGGEVRPQAAARDAGKEDPKPACASKSSSKDFELVLCSRDSANMVVSSFLRSLGDTGTEILDTNAVRTEDSPTCLVLPGNIATTDPVEICEHLDKALRNTDGGNGNGNTTFSSKWLGTTKSDRTAIREKINQINVELDVPLDSENPDKQFLQFVENVTASASAHKFLCGDALTIADVVVYSHIVKTRHLEKVEGSGSDVSRAWLRRMEAVLN